jgi:hypothetical protein
MESVLVFLLYPAFLVAGFICFGCVMTLCLGCALSTEMRKDVTGLGILIGVALPSGERLPGVPFSRSRWHGPRLARRMTPRRTVRTSRAVQTVGTRPAPQLVGPRSSGDESNVETRWSPNGVRASHPSNSWRQAHGGDG